MPPRAKRSTRTDSSKESLPSKTAKKAPGKVPAQKTTAFKVFDVREKQPMRTLLEKSGIKLEKGRAFYELTKSETIQDYKRLVVMRKSDSSFITGEAVRDVLNIPKATVLKFHLELEELPDFAVFVQSTSHNRQVHPDTRLLYDMREAGADDSLPDADPDVDDMEEDPPAATGSKGTTVAPAKKKETKAKSPAVAGGVEICFSFDTTGSMYACLGEVRRKLKETIQRLQDDIPGIRMAVIAHGDYCDEASSYVTKHIDFTDKLAPLLDFVHNVGCTGGGDMDECYELVLHEAHSKLSWSEGSQRSLVVIGDANPHGPSYPLNKQKLDWKKECEALKRHSVRVYSVQCLNRSCSTAFYREMARLTDGFHLVMDQFSSIVNFMLAICYNERGSEQLESFEEEMKGRGINRELHRLFDSLAGRTTAFTASGGAAGLVPINPSRFQVLTVDKGGPIKEFVQKNSLLFKTGRGFYEFTKPENISAKKEVVLVDKVTGDMFTGQEACDMIGAGGSAKIRPASLDKFRVFVQSTSYNRVLVQGTGFLYEVDEDR